MSSVESGRLGRIAIIRLKPNQDLIEGIEAAAAEQGIRDAVVRTAVGSLVDAALSYGAAGRRDVPGPGVEILTLSGGLKDGLADLRGTVSDSQARVHGGRFVKGANPICITLELVLQEWLGDLPSPAADQ